MCVQVSMQYTYLIIYLLLIMINEIIMYLMKILNLVNNNKVNSMKSSLFEYSKR